MLFFTFWLKHFSSMQITLNFSKSYYTSFDLMQIWRMLDLIYRPEDEVLAELDKYKSYILGSDSDT
jgi:hypothetical protein